MSMKKFVLSLVAALAISPVMADDSVNLAGLGLGGLQPVSEAAGMKVRGLSSSAQGFSMAVASALIIDPSSGSSARFDASAFNTVTDENGGFDEASAASTVANLVFPTLSLDIDAGTDSFVGSVSNGAIFSNTQGGAGTPFAFDLPTFDFFFDPAP